MKKIVAYPIGLIFLFAFFLGLFSSKEIVDFIWVFRWNILMSQWNFYDAQSKYIWVSELWISDYNQSVLDYDTGNTFYWIKNFSWALKYYSKVKDIDKNLSYFKYHNIWNSLYRLWQLQQDELKVLTWEKSLQSYQIALKTESLSDKKETLANYEFVLEELEKLKKKLQEQKDEDKKNEQKIEEEKKEEEQKNEQKPEEKKDDEGKEDKSSDNALNKWDNSTSGQQQNANEQKSWSSKWNFNQLWQNWSENTQNLSPEEKKELEDYSQYLKQFQKENLWQIQKWQPANPQDIYDNLLGNPWQNPIFNNQRPTTDKDW
ncbi:MAG: hypothetical protein ACD_3C00111G0028 [uncultured bacterium (gcode 4)]|uniref:Uncharacterized protein n=1 Tax=uncultured bacterium (gcode 4) TaxID=1234023 RepID=K2FA45_9BACT|nr:MAG: hypothetical protein ACD_3C00111G0028 [uncultured bacterium (gcode 4)]